MPRGAVRANSVGGLEQVEKVQEAVVAAGGGLPSNCSDGTFEDGVDFHSSQTQTGSAPGTGAADCCAQCAAQGPEKCLYFSFKKSAKECWFKLGDQGRESNPDVISGRCRGSSSGGTAVELGSSAGDAAGNGSVAIVFVQTSGRTARASRRSQSAASLAFPTHFLKGLDE